MYTTLTLFCQDSSVGSIVACTGEVQIQGDNFFNVNLLVKLIGVNKGRRGTFEIRVCKLKDYSISANGEISNMSLHWFIFYLAVLYLRLDRFV